jgi:alanyl-tRNA synthetase
MTTAELREAFQAFYAERGHLRVPSHSLIPPADDPTTLFIVAGMQQFKPYFLRTKEPPSNRVVSVQKCLRAGGKDSDLDDVGRTERHCSFFEMLGNFSFGDYFKDEAVDYAWDFVTKVMELEPARLWATVNEGDPLLGLKEDAIAIAAWERVGIPPERIVRLGKDNFWQAAETGPCGQCSEIFYDRGDAYACGDPACGPGHCDRYMEIYNLVFMEYDLKPGNKLEPLPAQNVDTGLGLERTMCVLQGVDSVFDTDGFKLIMDWVEQQSGVAYRDSEISQRAHRVLADHGRAVSFLIAEGVVPSNEGRGYICRRLLRRAILQAQRIGLDRIEGLPAVVIEQLGDAWPELKENAAEITQVVRVEEARFRETLQRGLKEFEALAGGPTISGDDAFTLVATFGFPIELTQELAEERGQVVDVDRFLELMEGHKEISRAGGEKTDVQRAAEFAQSAGFESRFVGYEQTDVLTQIGALQDLGDGTFLCKLRETPFYADSGGQVTDTGELIHEATGATAALHAAYKLGDDQALIFEGAGFAAGDRVRAVAAWSTRFPTMANHTATHLLHQALRDVLGDHVKQAGSAVRPDKLRFDFTHPQAMTGDERTRVERIVNEKVFIARAHVPDPDRRGPQARRDGALRREVRRDRPCRRDRGLLDRAVRRHACPLDGRDRAVRAAERGVRRLRRPPDRGRHVRRGLDGTRGPFARARRAPRRAHRVPPRGEEAAPRSRCSRRRRDRARDRGDRRRQRHRTSGRRAVGRRTARPLRPLQAARVTRGGRPRLARERHGAPRRELRRSGGREDSRRRHRPRDRADRRRGRGRAADDGPRRRQGSGEAPRRARACP